MNNSLILDSDIIDQEMQQAFRRSHGLTMLDFRTGSGKSFDLEKNIARFISNWHDGKPLMVGDSPETLRSIEQIVVVIPNKNNFLSLDGLADRLMEVSPNINILPEAKRIIQESVFVMPNNLDCMIEGLCHNGYVDDIKMNEILGSIEMLFKSSLIAKKLKRNFMSIANYAKQRNLQYTENLSESELKKYILEDLKNVANNAEKDIRENLRDFISNCKKIEKSEKVSEKERRIATIEKEKCIKLVTSFYKIACHDKYRVLIMTVDKFMNQIDPIISGKFYFYDSFYKKNFIEEKLFIFDESDSAYIKMRDCIITGINNGFPFKEYLKSLICNYLVNTQPTQAVANAIKEAKLKHGKKYSLQYFKKRGNEIFEKYYLNYSYKTDEVSEKNGKMPAILNDGTLYTLSEKKGYIHAVKSEIRKQVLLRVGNSSKDKPNILKDGEAVNIAQFFIEGTALIYDFCRFLNIVTQNYHNFMNRNEAEKAKKIEEETGKHVSGKRDVAFWDDFKTILHMFSVNNKEERDFYITVCRNLKNHPKRITLLDPDNSFYIRGYDLKMIRDNPVNQAENSIIYSYGVNVTPESILLKMAQLTHVICLSATALNRSVSENFDVSYLKRKLGDRFYTVSEKKKKELRAFYARREEPYVNGTCQIDVVILPENNAIVFEDNGYYRLKTETVLPTFCHPEIKKRILEMVSDNISQNGGGDYQKGRYLNLIRAIYEFIKTPSLVSMLVLENILL